MPRNMSFMLTTEQVRNKTKTVTRRLGWWFIKPGDIVNAVEKCQGLKKGEKVKKIWQIRILKTNPEYLTQINKEDCIKEGFSDMTPSDFILMFALSNKCTADAKINRIEFEYI